MADKKVASTWAEDWKLLQKKLKMPRRKDLQILILSGTPAKGQFLLEHS